MKILINIVLIAIIIVIYKKLNIVEMITVRLASIIHFLANVCYAMNRNRNEVRDVTCQALNSAVNSD